MAADASFAFDVFLSHNRAQKDWTRALARRLRDDGFQVWLDEWEMPKHAGKSGSGLMAIGVEQSRKVVLVFSPEFFANEWPVFEAEIIVNIDPAGRKERIVPIMHTAYALPSQFAFRQYLDFTSSPPGSEEFQFRYHQLVHNLDNSRPYEGDFERWKKQQGAAGTKPDGIPPVQPLPKGSRMPHAPNPLFVGREKELRELAKALTPGAAAAVGVHAAVTGMGGVGKTQLAIEYAHRYGRLYEGGVFWLNMERPENAQNEVALCGGPEGMDLLEFSALKLPEQAAKVHQIWEDERARFLVFDNVEEAEVVEELAAQDRPLLPAHHQPAERVAGEAGSYLFAGGNTSAGTVPRPAGQSAP